MKTYMLRTAAKGGDGAESGKGSPLPIIAATKGRKADGVDLADLPWDFSRAESADGGRHRFPLLWAHDLGGRNLPIGVVDVGIGEDGVSLSDSFAVFDPEDPFAVAIERKYRSPIGGLNAFSITWDDVDKDGMPARSTGNKPTAQQLMEVSGVPVPLDAAATKRGMDQALLLQRDIQAILDAATDIDNDPAEIAGLDTNGDEATRTADAPDLDEGEADDLAAEMVAIFDPAPEDSEAERSARYRAILPAYRRIGWTAPEWVDADELPALAPDVWRGLFVNGELDRASGERAGKELSDANVAALSEACDSIESGVTKLRALLDRAAGWRAAVAEPAKDAPVNQLNDNDAEFWLTLSRALAGTPTNEDAK